MVRGSHSRSDAEHRAHDDLFREEREAKREKRGDRLVHTVRETDTDRHTDRQKQGGGVKDGKRAVRRERRGEKKKRETCSHREGDRDRFQRQRERERERAGAGDSRRQDVRNRINRNAP